MAVVFKVVAFVAVRMKSVPAEEAPFNVTTPVAESVMRALVAAFAVILATFVLKALASEVPPIPPFVEVSTRLVALTAPVMLLLSKLFRELRVTVPTGVTALPMAAPTFNVPF